MDLQDSVLNHADEEVVFAFENAQVNVIAHEHDWVLTSETPATCTAAGEKVYTCSKCGGTSTEPVPALGHNPGEWVVEGNYEVKYCTRCGAELDRRPIETPTYLLGDVDGNGRINSRDLKLLQSYMARTADLEDINFANSDINNDGRVNNKDAKLLEYYLKQIIAYEDLLEAHGDLD